MVLLDLDGVVYRGALAVPHAADSLRTTRERGLGVGFVTNNASRSPEDVALHLGALGIPARATDVVTSGQAAATLLAAGLPSGAAVLVLGSDALMAAVADVGLQPVRRVAQAGPVSVSGALGVAAVVQGFARDITYEDLTEAALAIRAGARWVAANLDPTLPTERGLQPGNGALVAAISVATGRQPEVAGKPALALHDEALRRTGAQRPLVVGDRLDTDIAGARAAGAPSLLVLSGVATIDDLASAPEWLRPTYVAADLRGLLVKHTGATGVNGVGRCGSAEARCVPETGLISLVASACEETGVANVDDQVRAAVVAAWSLPARERGWHVHADGCPEDFAKLA